MKKILILGATGFIGTNLLNFYKNKKGYEVYATYRSAKTKINKVKWLVLNKVDLISKDNLEELKSELENQSKDNLNIYCISAAKKEGTQQLMRDIGEFMETSNE